MEGEPASRINVTAGAHCRLKAKSTRGTSIEITITTVFGHIDPVLHILSFSGLKSESTMHDFRANSNIMSDT